MHGSAADPQDLMGSIDSLASAIVAQNDKLHDVRRQVAGLRGKGRSADERVEVEVDQFGALSQLKIDPRAMRLGSEELAQAILSAARHGIENVHAQAEALMRPLITELMLTNRRMDAAHSAGQDLDDVLAALQDVRHDLRM
ncbi:YbaB/EbfC family nucleoid-associated protein [Actinomadura sp. DC4]|uniref:YbaB/EbfC family nucleoid-associated protein n=1 Tax=Actinomadura sp. DC4 TaxID=3055069 RepID=UPI0025AFE2CD|nr:YbaB/EbfC family nucleoid-associated protein [Actinomadura sp. DC4]MDN3352913.1 YbaB/EbfC family nucleoid-associated protein [Actinomadura sp. DC4]